MDRKRPDITAGISAICPTRATVALAIITVLGIVSQFVLSWFSIGSNDFHSWSWYADDMTREGILHNYLTIPRFNHPPIAAYYMTSMFWLGTHTGLPLPFLFRIAPIVADAGCCALLWRIYARRDGLLKGWMMAAFFAWCPASVLVSAYHCNTDGVYVFFALLAAYYIAEKQDFLRGGLALGAAINIKLIPVLLILPFFSLCRDWRDAKRMFVGLAVCTLPFLPLLVEVPQAFYTNVLSYNSEANRWGLLFINALLRNYPDMESLDVSDWVVYYSDHCRQIVQISSVAVAFISWRFKWWNAYEVAFMAMAAFLFFTTNLGVQYMVAPLAFICAAHFRLGVAYGLAAGIMLATVYGLYWTGAVPIESYFPGAFIPVKAAFAGLMAWCVLGFCMAKFLWRSKVPAKITG